MFSELPWNYNYTSPGYPHIPVIPASLPASSWDVIVTANHLLFVQGRAATASCPCSDQFVSIQNTVRDRDAGKGLDSASLPGQPAVPISPFFPWAPLLQHLHPEHPHHRSPSLPVLLPWEQRDEVPLVLPDLPQGKMVKSQEPSRGSSQAAVSAHLPRGMA